MNVALEKSGEKEAGAKGPGGTASNRGPLVAAAAIVLIAIIGSGVLAYRWWGGEAPVNSNQAANANVASAASPSPTATPSPSPSPSPRQNANKRSQIKARNEKSSKPGFVEKWKRRIFGKKGR